MEQVRYSSKKFSWSTFELVCAIYCKRKELIKPALLLVVLSFFLFGYLLHWQNGFFRAVEAVLFQTQWMILVCLVVWCMAIFFLTFNLNDLPLIGLLFIASFAYLIGYTTSQSAADIIILFFGITLGKGAAILIINSKWRTRKGIICKVQNFLVGLVLLLAFSSWWHLGTTHTSYHGPRWMGLWDNPNTYGMLMGAGGTLAIGLRAGMKNEGETLKPEKLKYFNKAKGEKRKLLLSAIKSAIGNWQSAILLVAAGMMAVGLVMSYSRGAWVATAIGSLYLAWRYGKLKWRYVVIGVGCVALGAGLFWGRTSDNGPWYFKRLDFSRPSAQHRVSAWRGAVQIMRDHPFGVGWNNAVSVYEKSYSPPENGAAALTMNSYLMLGTELGLPGLICFVAYVGLQLKSGRRKVESGKYLHLTPALSPSICFSPHNPHPASPSSPVPTGEGQSAGIGEGESLPVTSQTPSPVTCHLPLQAACRAGAIVLLVAFWFDGGLFDLPTASVFWILLELG